MARHDLSGRNRLDWSSPGLRLFPGRAAGEKAATIATGGGQVDLFGNETWCNWNSQSMSLRDSSSHNHGSD